MGQMCCIFFWRNLTNNTIFKTRLPQKSDNGNYEGKEYPNPKILEQDITSQTGEQHTQFTENQQQHVTKIPNEQWNQLMCGTELLPVNDTTSVPTRLNQRCVVTPENSRRLASDNNSWAPPIPARHFGYVNLPIQNSLRQQILSESGPPKPPRHLVSSSEEPSRQQICDVSSAHPLSVSGYNRSQMDLQQLTKGNTLYAKGPPKPPRLFTYNAETPPRQHMCDELSTPPIPPRQHNVRVPTIQHVYIPPVPPRDFTRSNRSLKTTADHLKQDISSLLLYRPQGELAPIEEDLELNISSSLAS